MTSDTSFLGSIVRTGISSHIWIFCFEGVEKTINAQESNENKLSRLIDKSIIFSLILNLDIIYRIDIKVFLYFNSYSHKIHLYQTLQHSDIQNKNYIKIIHA